MAERIGRKKGELAKAEITVQELEAQLEHVKALLKERKAEKLTLMPQSKVAAAGGDINRLVAIENRSVAIDKTIAEWVTAETECAERVEAARRYLYTLYVRLEKLRKEARELTRRLQSIETPGAGAQAVETNLSRVKVQIKAIVGDAKTGQLLTGLGSK
jgi:flagellar biosynthesis chaperone FliJ